MRAQLFLRLRGHLISLAEPQEDGEVARKKGASGEKRWPGALSSTLAVDRREIYTESKASLSHWTTQTSYTSGT